MCMFSRSVRKVSGTYIFARRMGRAQALVYSMVYESDTEVAMILPLPVAPGSGEDSVRFISMEDYPRFFTEMEQGFSPSARSWGLGRIAHMFADAGPTPRGGAWEPL